MAFLPTDFRVTCAVSGEAAGTVVGVVPIPTPDHFLGVPICGLQSHPGRGDFLKSYTQDLPLSYQLVGGDEWGLYEEMLLLGGVWLSHANKFGRGGLG